MKARERMYHEDDPILDSEAWDFDIPEFNFDFPNLTTWNVTLAEIHQLPVTYNCPAEER